MIKANPRYMQTPFGGLVNDLFGTPGIQKWFDEDLFKPDFFDSFPPVNIHENKTGYALEVAAPGWEKSDFKLNVEGNTLYISADKKEEKTQEESKQIRKEFKQKSFKRAFTLDESIEAGSIQAKYENGILKINLPKKQEEIQPKKEITVE